MDLDTALATVNGLLREQPGDPEARLKHPIRRARLLLDALGRPDDGLPIILIGGTSGKGSVAMFCESVLRAHGLRVGTYTSPFLQTPLEVARIDGRLVDPAKVPALVETVMRAIRQVEREHPEMGQPHYLEAWMGVAFLAFRDAACEAAVVEVGMGGRYDRTNALEPQVSVINTVNYDHVRMLGGTLASIAWHKAGIMRAERVTVTGAMEAEAEAVVHNEAEHVGARLVAPQPFELPVLGLVGPHQAANARTALSALSHFTTLNAPLTERALAETRFAGRLETVQHEPHILLDGAHNGEKMAALAGALRASFDYERLIVVLGLLRTKRVGRIIGVLAPLADILIATSCPVVGKPAYSADELASGAEGFAQVEAVPEPQHALNRAIELAGPRDLIVVTGSLYLVGALRERWYPTNQIHAQRTMFPRIEKGAATPRP